MGGFTPLSEDDLIPLTTDVAAVQTTVDAIEVDTTALQVDTTAIQAETDKIDSAATLGLLGPIKNSLAYRVAEIERHFHGRGRWFGAAGTPSGETHVADFASDVTGADPAAVVLSTGAGGTYGAYVQILGSSDTPYISGNAYFDPHAYLVSAASSTSPYVLELVAGESASLAAAIAAGLFSTVMYVGGNAANDHSVEAVMGSRIPAGTKVWARARCIGQDVQTINLYGALHEYEG